MTAALYDEAVTVARAPKLTLVPAVDPASAPEEAAAPKKTTRRPDTQPVGTGGDPLVDGAARLLSAPMRQLYAVLWRVGLLEVV